LGNRGRADKADRDDIGVVQQRASWSSLTTLKTPGGKPASVSSSAMRNPGEGSR
jgi:hypothetical protein